jgi:hypothetical protein
VNLQDESFRAKKCVQSAWSNITREAGQDRTGQDRTGQEEREEEMRKDERG